MRSHVLSSSSRPLVSEQLAHTSLNIRYIFLYFTLLLSDWNCTPIKELHACSLARNLHYLNPSSFPLPSPLLSRDLPRDSRQNSFVSRAFSFRRGKKWEHIFTPDFSTDNRYDKTRRQESGHPRIQGKPDGEQTLEVFQVHPVEIFLCKSFFFLAFGRPT